MFDMAFLLRWMRLVYLVHFCVVKFAAFLDFACSTWLFADVPVVHHTILDLLGSMEKTV